MNMEDRKLRQRTKIMRDDRFIAIAGVMMQGKCEYMDSVPTAATNGRDVFLGAKFCEGLTDEVFRFVLLHEYYHVMFQHMTLWKPLWDENPQLANRAADAVINIMLDKVAGAKADGFIEVWEHAILDYQYDGMDTGEVFRKMKQQQQQQGGKGSPSRSASGGEPQDFDQHQPAQGEGEEGDPHDGIPPLTPEEAKEVQKAVDMAIRQASQMAGRMGANVDRAFSDLLEVVTPWEEVLQEFVKTYAAGNDLSTWRKLSRRWMARDMKMPSRYSEAAKRISIGIDTSGSISDAQITRAMSEIKAACDTVHPEFVDVIYWDAVVTAHEIYEGDAVSTLTDVTKPKGGGGTCVRSMLDYMKAKDIRPDCIIIFTDGFVEADWGGTEWPAPVLWCVSTKGIVAPHGKTLYVPA